jgi:hypothetical protein
MSYEVANALFEGLDLLMPGFIHQISNSLFTLIQGHFGAGG